MPGPAECVDAWAAARGAASWRGLEQLEEAVGRVALRAALLLPAFYSLLLPLPVPTQLAVAHALADAVHADARAVGRPVRRHAQPRGSALCLTLLRASANQNAERLLTLLALDRRTFDARLYATSSRAADAVSVLSHDALGESDETALVQLADCDILIDACGHTAGGRPALLARRPCRLATSALGYAASYGGGLVDYLTADRVVLAPAVQAAEFRPPERLSMLPYTYQARAIRPPAIMLHHACADYTTHQPTRVRAAGESDAARRARRPFNRARRACSRKWLLGRSVRAHVATARR